MNYSKTFLLAAGALALASASAANATDDAHGGAAADTNEKCYGVAKAGKNDCANAAGTHSCAGQATQDAEAGEWVYLPKGTCDKLVGGSTEPHA